jgi:hypothetical protein
MQKDDRGALAGLCDSQADSPTLYFVLGLG